ncbi:hypothetical protein BDZ91DRAFT_336461 [Kalaharituber pfeilii]|nr:hypothetical protein BDZ91DRAFT_336461 [Kalaharituber pfeilii]
MQCILYTLCSSLCPMNPSLAHFPMPSTSPLSSSPRADGVSCWSMLSQSYCSPGSPMPVSIRKVLESMVEYVWSMCGCASWRS